MKRIICLITILCIVFGSFSLCFAANATWSTTDSQNLANAAGRLYYMNQSAAYYLYNIASNTNNIYNKCVDIYNALFYGNHNITYWVNSISTWMSPIYNSLTSLPVDLNAIKSGLWKPLSNGSEQAYLSILDKALAAQDNWTSTDRYYNAHAQLVNANGVYSMPLVPNDALDGSFNLYDRTWTQGSPLGNVAYLLHDHMINNVREYHNRWLADLNGYNTTQSARNWLTLSGASFTPTSAINGIYTWLKRIQDPTARLSYVLASEERIEAQEAAAANEEAVVDNFIDSSGPASASTSDIGSISNLSSGYKSNFGSDASVTGIFNIFNSNNMGWFSSETYNQLDTTSNNRRTKSDSLPDTPLLDQKINDIYEAIGLDNDR